MQRVLARGSKLVPIDSVFSDAIKTRPLDEDRIVELMASFASKGQQQPIKVRPNSNGSHVVVFGEHRLEAAKRLGWKEISAVVEDIDEHEALELKITENAHRNGFVDPWEEGRIFVRLLSEKYGNNLNALSDALGKKSQYIKDRIGVYYNLDATLRRFVGHQLTVANAISLARIYPVEKQVAMAMVIVKTRTSGASGFGSGAGRGASGRFIGRTRVRPFHQCTCGCGDIHEDKRGSSSLVVDPNEEGVGVKVVLGRLGPAAKESHLEDPSSDQTSYCGLALPERWQAELPEHFDTRAIRVDGMYVCDSCARRWRKEAE